MQYTRNMVTGASTADLAIILIDARHGLVEQTTAQLHRIAVGHQAPRGLRQQDGPGFNEDAYQTITSAFRNFSSRLDIPDIKFIPSARCWATMWWKLQ